MNHFPSNLTIDKAGINDYFRRQRGKNFLLFTQSWAFKNSVSSVPWNALDTFFWTLLYLKIPHVDGKKGRNDFIFFQTSGSSKNDHDTEISDVQDSQKSQQEGNQSISLHLIKGWENSAWFSISIVFSRVQGREIWTRPR